MIQDFIKLGEKYSIGETNESNAFTERKKQGSALWVSSIYFNRMIQ
jgi:hypothetical protein